MAVVQDPNQDSSNTASGAPQQSQTGNFNQPISVSGAAASGPGGYKAGASGAGGQTSGNTAASSSGNTAATTNAPSSSGQYNNLQNYVNANQNYTNNGGLASQLSSDYNKQAQGAQNNITDASNNWYNTNSSSDVDPNQAQTYVNGALQNASTFSQDPNNVSQFQNYLNAGTNYVAPTQFDPTQMYQQQVQNYNQSVGQLGSSTGRQAALQQMYSNPYYSQGQQSLDNLILGSGVNTNTGVNQLQQLQQNTAGYGQNLQNVYNNTASGINGTIDPTTGQYAGGAMGQYANDAATTQANTQGAFTNAVNNAYGNVQNQVNTNNQGAAQTAQTYANTLNGGNVTSDMVKSLGIDPITGLYGLTGLGQYIVNDSPTATLTNSITTPEQQMMAGYSTLLGSNVLPTTTVNGVSNSPNSELSSFTGNTQAGTWAPNISFDNNSFNNADQKAQAAYNQVTGKAIGNPDDVLNGTDISSLDPYDAYNTLESTINGSNWAGNGSYAGPIGYTGNQKPSSAPGELQNEENQAQQLANVMSQYGINSNTGVANGLNLIQSAPSGPSIGQNGTNIPMHGGGIIIPGANPTSVNPTSNDSSSTAALLQKAITGQ